MDKKKPRSGGWELSPGRKPRVRLAKRTEPRSGDGICEPLREHPDSTSHSCIPLATGSSKRFTTLLVSYQCE